jgi:DnaJ domain
MELVALVRDAYATLGVPFGAPADAVRSAYRSGVRSVHPDVGGEAPNAATRLGELRAAYERVKPLAQPVAPWTKASALAAYAPPLPEPTLDVLG